MKKIKFNQPKFIIPLLVLPFLFLGFYMFSSFFPEQKAEGSNLETFEGINTNIPDPALEEKAKSKLEEFQDALNKRRENTGMDVKVKEDDFKKIEVEKDTTSNSILLNRGVSARERLRQLAQERLKNAGRRSSPRTTSGRSNTSLRTNRTNKKTKDEMKDFRKQMRFIDSLSNPGKYNKKAALFKKMKLDSIAKAQRMAETLKISKTPGQQNDYFNTIKANSNETFISAILDEGIKVYRESRVRIRVMDDVFIGEKLIPKGHYLYGTVSNFQAQRVIIGISSIIINDQIIPVNISLYDNDGMEGIYVPNTLFRQFAQELGVQTTSNAGSVDIETNGSGKNPLFESVSNAVQVSSKAIQKALRSNKVRVKYSHKVYLVNNKN